MNVLQQRRTLTTTLYETLAKLEIEPLPQPVVAHYQLKSVEEKHEELKPFRWTHYPDNYSNDEFSISRWFNHCHPTKSSIRFYRPSHALRAVFAALGQDTRPIYVGLWWERTVTDPAAVPEFVRRKMIQIKSEIPDASFYTETLRDEKTTYDPLLIVQLRDEEYYIDVWGDNGKFDAFYRHNQ